MEVLLRRGRVIDTSASSGEASDVVDAVRDVRIVDGYIAEVGEGLEARGQELDCAGKLVIPGLIDLRSRLCEPGFEYKEDIQSGTAAAAAGGYTTVTCLPDTKPVNDCRSVSEAIMRRASEVGAIRVHLIGAASQGMEGRELAEIGELVECGVLAVAHATHAIADPAMLRRVLEYARTFDVPLFQTPHDPALSRGTCMAEGAVATRLGLRGSPAQGETAILARDLELVELTGARYHAGPLSAGRSAAILAEAKKRGISATGSVSVHHLMFCDEDCATYDSATKFLPPLRTASDRDLLRVAVAEGIIDAVVSDHWPQSQVEKELEFDYAAPGASSFETTLPAVMTLVKDGVLSLHRAVDALTARPARILGIDEDGRGSLAVGAPGDVCVVDPSREVTVDGLGFRSKSRSTPFQGRTLVGTVDLTLVAGERAFAMHGEDAK